MRTHLETATLIGTTSTMPGIPLRDTKVDVIDDGAALIIRDAHGNYGLAIAYEQIKQANAFVQQGNALIRVASTLFTFGTWPTDDWYVAIVFYSSLHDMDISLDLLIGNSAGGPLTMQKRAIALAKTIWEIRSQRLVMLRDAMIVRYR